MSSFMFSELVQYLRSISYHTASEIELLKSLAFTIATCETIGKQNK